MVIVMAISEAKKKADERGRKKALKQFKVYVRKEIYDEIDKLCEEQGISKAEFVRRALEAQKGKKDGE